MTALSDQSPIDKAEISPTPDEIVIPTFSIITTISEFNKLQEEWNTLFEAHASGTQLFQTYNWIWHWIHQFENNPKDIKILTGHIDKKLVLLAPLVQENKLGLKILKWVGEPVSQYGDILIAEDPQNLQWLKAGFNYLNDTLKPDLFYLRKTRFDAAITPLLEMYSATILEETAAPYIEVLGDKDFTEFNKRYSQKSRKAKRRHRRKLEEKGPLTFNLYEEGSEANRAANHAINLKREWLKATKTISPAFNGPLIDNFFDATSKENNHSANIKVSELCVDNHPAAIEIGILVKDYYGAHLGVYDPAYIAHSPGSLQMQDTIAALIEKGVKVIDLFAPGDKYKYEWTDLSVPVYDFAYSTSLKGKIYEEAFLKRARPALKSAVQTVSKIAKDPKSVLPKKKNKEDK
jgi:CelD/BcsL family acetyltransferase involved in cellulose biosynthesis